jgi:hypothetical protein
LKMSFEANDMNTIHLGNYEEFFILYMDNELNNTQVKMVDEFLAAHPDLKAEFEMLASTKLPFEEFSFDKAGLMAENMRLSSVDEELLLYIDNELASGENKKVELELASNKDYQAQHQVLLQAKLDPSEKIAYPNKKELYRREERVVSIKIWMRVAAAVIVIAVGGILYFQKPSSSSSTTSPGITAGPSKNNKTNEVKKNGQPNLVIPSSEISRENEIAVSNKPKKEVKQNTANDKTDVKVESPVQQNEIAYTPEEVKEDVIERPVVRSIEANPDKNIEETTAAINNSDVTSPLLERKIYGTPDDPGGPIANDDRKGSFKGFLRKATRIIEKRTGIDPTNDGELLIGAVAINLK